MRAILQQSIVQQTQFFSSYHLKHGPMTPTQRELLEHFYQTSVSYIYQALENGDDVQDNAFYHSILHLTDSDDDPIHRTIMTHALTDCFNIWYTLHPQTNYYSFS